MLWVYTLEEHWQGTVGTHNICFHRKYENIYVDTALNPEQWVSDKT